MGRELNRVEKKLVEDVRAMTSSLKNTVERLRKLADDLDEVWNGCWDHRRCPDNRGRCRYNHDRWSCCTFAGSRHGTLGNRSLN